MCASSCRPSTTALSECTRIRESPSGIAEMPLPLGKKAHGARAAHAKVCGQRDQRSVAGLPIVRECHTPEKRSRGVSEVRRLACDDDIVDADNAGRQERIEGDLGAGVRVIDCSAATHPSGDIQRGCAVEFQPTAGRPAGTNSVNRPIRRLPTRIWPSAGRVIRWKASDPNRPARIQRLGQGWFLLDH